MRIANSVYQIETVIVSDCFDRGSSGHVCPCPAL